MYLLQAYVLSLTVGAGSLFPPHQRNASLSTSSFSLPPAGPYLQMDRTRKTRVFSVRRWMDDRGI